MSTRPWAILEPYWCDFDSRSTVRGESPKWTQPHARTCLCDSPDRAAQCSRELGHPGRHIASLGGGWGHRVVAAWPDTHPPRKADLT